MAVHTYPIRKLVVTVRKVEIIDAVIFGGDDTLRTKWEHSVRLDLNKLALIDDMISHKRVLRLRISVVE